MSETKSSLFNNPMIDAAKNALTIEQQQEYAKMGEYMFNLVKDEIPQNEETEKRNTILHAREALKSGLHPQDLSYKEIQFLYEVYGDEWYKEFGYKTKEVPLNPLVKSDKVPLTKKQVRNLKKKLKKKLKK